MFQDTQAEHRAQLRADPIQFGSLVSDRAVLLLFENVLTITESLLEVVPMFEETACECVCYREHHGEQNDLPDLDSDFGL